MDSRWNDQESMGECKVLGNSIKGKKKIHLKFIFSVESMLAILSIHCSFLHYDHIDTMGLPYVLNVDLVFCGVPGG